MKGERGNGAIQTNKARGLQLFETNYQKAHELFLTRCVGRNLVVHENRMKTSHNPTIWTPADPFFQIYL